MSRPHPANVPGPFYVEDGCCTTCGVPESIAPDLFGWTEGCGHCFVRCQPDTQDRLDRMIVAIASGEMDCILYRGSDPAIAQRVAMARYGMAGRPSEIRPLLRMRVGFRSRRTEDTTIALAKRLRTWLGAEPNMHVQNGQRWSEDSAIFAWGAGALPRLHYNSVRFEQVPDRFHAYLSNGHPGAEVGLGLLVHRWLADVEQAERICWYPGDSDCENGFPMPI